MGPAFTGVGAINKRKIGFTVVIAVGKGKFQGTAYKMDGRIDGLTAHFPIKQIKQAIFGKKLLFIAKKTEPGI